jgi:integrase
MLRLARAEKGPKMFEADELRQILDVASPGMKAMILLGINCGFGNSDIAKLSLKAVDPDKGWIDYPRPKTGVARRCPLWPETIGALKEWLAVRPTPKGEADPGLLFVTKYGNAWDKGNGDRAITHEMRKLLDSLGINGHRNFYALRHTFETIAGESRDQVAVDAVMGHDNGSMAGLYRERISDERLQEVADVVRTWLFPTKKTNQ